MKFAPVVDMPEGFVALERHLSEWHDVSDAVLDECTTADMRLMHKMLHNRVKKGRSIRRAHTH